MADADGIEQKYNAKHGRMYYKNVKTGKTAWNRADVLDGGAASSSPSPAPSPAPAPAATVGSPSGELGVPGGASPADALKTANLSGGGGSGGGSGGGEDHIVQFYSKVGRIGYKNTRTGKCGWSREEVCEVAAAEAEARKAVDTGECFKDGFLEKYQHDVVLDSLFEFKRPQKRNQTGGSDTRAMVSVSRFKQLMVQGIEVWRRNGRKSELIAR